MKRAKLTPEQAQQAVQMFDALTGEYDDRYAWIADHFGSTKKAARAALETFWVRKTERVSGPGEGFQGVVWRDGTCEQFDVISDMNRAWQIGRGIIKLHPWQVAA